MSTLQCCWCPAIITHREMRLCNKCSQAFCGDCFKGHECVRGEAQLRLRSEQNYPADAPPILVPGEIEPENTVQSKCPCCEEATEDGDKYCSDLCRRYHEDELAELRETVNDQGDGKSG